ncbi:1-acyl-sn-glycerol-3-phosphate acyltransferase [Geitlerinema splendidum]|nr:1-acyl-sn-glycerol-3-phosphate acyltransferase [Geitlerinema splendidum]
MTFQSPLHISDSLLTISGTHSFVYHSDRIPQTGSIIVVSNHRSFMDAFLLMSALRQPIRFACHHYMGQVPLVSQLVENLGCFPLAAPERRQQHFFEQATHLLQQQQVVGIFPEGAQPMVKKTQAYDLGQFHRGFAHLALRTKVPHLAVLPVAIASIEEDTNSAVPLRLLTLFDPSEPLFQQPGWHPMIIYRRVNLLVGRPYWITQPDRDRYQGKQAKAVVSELSDYCHAEISQLLQAATPQ